MQDLISGEMQFKQFLVENHDVQMMNLPWKESAVEIQNNQTTLRDFFRGLELC